MARLTELGRVGQDRIVLDVVPVITAGAYSLGDAIGGRLEFDGATAGAGETGVLEMIRLVDRAQQNVALDLVLFDQAFTAIADNAVFAPSDADLENCLGVVNVAAADYFNFSTNAVAVVSPVSPDGWGFPVQTVGSDILYGQLVVRSGPPTYVATTDIRVRLTLRRD